MGSHTELNSPPSCMEIWDRMLLRTRAIALQIEDLVSKALTQDAGSGETPEKTADDPADAVPLSGGSDAPLNASSAS
jgi:hypothetical protein